MASVAHCGEVVEKDSTGDEAARESTKTTNDRQVRQKWDESHRVKITETRYRKNGTKTDVGTAPELQKWVHRPAGIIFSSNKSGGRKNEYAFCCL